MEFLDRVHVQVVHVLHAFDRGFGAREIWLMDSRGGSRRQILTADKEHSIQHIAWAPGGNRIAFIHSREAADRPEVSIETCDLNGGTRATIVRDDAMGESLFLK